MAVNLDVAIRHVRTVASSGCECRIRPGSTITVCGRRHVATIGQRCFSGPHTWRSPSGHRYFSRATGSRICALWRRAGAGSSWIGARRTGTPARHEGLWRAEDDGAQQTADHTPPPAM